MKSSNILWSLVAITLCTSICIAETYTTTRTYYEPVRTTTTTVYDATTNPMYSVNRNDKIQAVQGQLSAPKTVTTTTTTQPVNTYKKVTTTVIDETTNPMYSVDRNDKIQAVQGQLSTPKSVTTTVITEPVNTAKTVTKTVVEETKNVKDKVEAKAQEIVVDNQRDVERELAYYESLRTCTMGSMNSSKLSLRTYGNNNGLCNFDMAKENPKTGRMVTVCTFNAPMDATKKYAENMLKYEKGLIGLEKLSTADFTALTSSLSTFTQQYCK